MNLLIVIAVIFYGTLAYKFIAGFVKAFIRKSEYPTEVTYKWIAILFTVHVTVAVLVGLYIVVKGLVHASL